MCHYDASGNRVLRKSTSGAALTVYAFGLEEYTYTGSGSFSACIHSYQLAGHLVAELNGSTFQFELTDALGSVLLSLSNSAVLGEQVYGPYGNQRYTSGTMGTNKGYTGQTNDVLTGLDYYNARYYDPAVGVFLSPDSVQGNMQGMSPYAYVAGNPETMTERSHNMWREFIQDLKSTVQYPLEIEFTNGVNEEQIKTLEIDLSVVLSEDLKTLLCESNGVSDQYGLGIIWSLENIILYNREMRTLPHYKDSYMTFTDLLFFADAGNGDRFAFPIIHGQLKENTVFAWNHENDSRWEVAFSLKSYLEQFLGGKMKL